MKKKKTKAKKKTEVIDGNDCLMPIDGEEDTSQQNPTKQGTQSQDKGNTGTGEEGDKTPHQQLEPYKWKKGQSGNPKGRPKGTRNKLSEDFLKDLHSVWLEHGMQALEAMRVDKPSEFVKVVAQVVPKDFQVTVNDNANSYVINGQPLTSTDDWLESHGLSTDLNPAIESDTCAKLGQDSGKIN